MYTIELCCDYYAFKHCISNIDHNKWNELGHKITRLVGLRSCQSGGTFNKHG